MSSGPGTPSYHTSEDEKILHKLGYAQELFRAMGGFRNFAISFTIISILAGCLTSYFVAFERGGPVAVTWGWLLVGLMSTLIALSMAEIASAYPTAGGLYYWASKLGGPGWGWATGWFNLIGQVAVTAAIGYGLATFATVLFDYWFSYTTHMDDWFGASANMSIYILYAAFLLAACLINVLNIRITSGLNMFSAWWHMIGVAIIVGVLIIVPDQHQSLSYVFTETINVSGYGNGVLRVHAPDLLVRLRARAAAVPVHDHRLRRFRAHCGGDAQRVARGRGRHVDLRGRLGHLRLDPAARDVSIRARKGRSNIDIVVPWIWAESMNQNWPRRSCSSACWRVPLGHPSATSASRMMFAFSRDRACPDPYLAARGEEPRARVLGLRHRCLRWRS